MRTRSAINTIGTTLVLLVVALVPTLLCTLSLAPGATDATLTTADASAAALHGLDRSLHTAPTPGAFALVLAWTPRAATTLAVRPCVDAYPVVPATSAATTQATHPVQLL